jgi:hypothetical protein
MRIVLCFLVCLGHQLDVELLSLLYIIYESLSESLFLFCYCESLENKTTTTTKTSCNDFFLLFNNYYQLKRK